MSAALNHEENIYTRIFESTSKSQINLQKHTLDK